MKCINYLALLLIIIGALNWGLWGFFQFDLVAWLTGGNTVWAARVIYSIIGLAGLWSLKFLGCCCRKKCCCSSCCNGSNSCCNKSNCDCTSCTCNGKCNGNCNCNCSSCKNCRK